MGNRREFYPQYKAKKTWRMGEDGRPVYNGSVVLEKRGRGKQWDALFTMQDFGEAREKASVLNDAVINHFYFK